MTKRKTVTKVLIIALIALGAVIAVMIIKNTYDNRFNVNIDKIEVAYQDSNGVRTTNYIAVLSQDVDWNASTDREGIAKYVVRAVLKETVTKDVRYFNILGQTADRKMAFLYNHEKGTIYLYQDGTVSGEVAFTT